MPAPIRQLAAIMFTDIVGYTALMGKDSSKAMELVRQSKSIQKPLVEKHHGKWIKEMGDGLLAQFNSALDAVHCAIEIQRASRADFEADLRIGIHLGDITIENDDVYGDGVNVASRLESIADPGGIYISESIEKAIRGQSDVLAKYLGEIKLKNVDYDVRTYALQGVGLPIPELKEKKELSGHVFAELQRRGVFRAGITYIIIAVILLLIYPFGNDLFKFPLWTKTVSIIFLIVGFPIALYLAWSYERSPEGFVKTTSKQSWRNPYNTSQRKPLTSNFILVIMGLILIIMYVYPRYLINTASYKNDGNEAEIEDKSIAVLPFENLSSDDENQYFADGQMEAILNHLTRIAELRVISRTTMMAYRGTAKSVPDIARELGVRYVLEGSVQKAGQQVRITAQLIDSGSDEHLWSENYDRDLADIFGIQTEIAKKVAQELKTTITTRERTSIESVPTSDLTAYDFYLKGLNYESRSNAEEDLRYALQMYERAVELDTKFTLAWVGLASASRSMYWFYHDRTTGRLEQTKAYLDKATSLDPDLLEVKIETGRYYYQCQLNYPKALEILEGLLSQYPKNDQLQYWTGLVYRRMGQFEKAFEFMDRGIKLNPSEWDLWQNTAGTLVSLRKYKQAESYYKTALELNPSLRVTYVFLCRVYILTGELEKAIAFVNDHFEHFSDSYYIRSDIKLMERKFEQAISILDSASEITGINPFSYTPNSMQLGLIYYMTSNEEKAYSQFQEARRILEEKRVEWPDDSRIYSSLGIVYAGLGMHKEALDAGNKALSIMNISVDAMRGSSRELDMAKILLMVGEYNNAINKLEGLIQQRGNMTVELLKLDPFWDPLREMDAFKALINNPRNQIRMNDN